MVCVSVLWTRSIVKHHRQELLRMNENQLCECVVDGLGRFLACVWGRGGILFHVMLLEDVFMIHRMY